MTTVERLTSAVEEFFYHGEETTQEDYDAWAAGPYWDSLYAFARHPTLDVFYYSKGDAIVAAQFDGSGNMTASTVLLKGAVPPPPEIKGRPQFFDTATRDPVALGTFMGLDVVALAGGYRLIFTSRDMRHYPIDFQYYQSGTQYGGVFEYDLSPDGMSMTHVRSVSTMSMPDISKPDQPGRNYQHINTLRANTWGIRADPRSTGGGIYVLIGFWAVTYYEDGVWSTTPCYDLDGDPFFDEATSATQGLSLDSNSPMITPFDISPEGVLSIGGAVYFEDPNNWTMFGYKPGIVEVATDGPGGTFTGVAEWTPGPPTEIEVSNDDRIVGLAIVAGEVYYTVDTFDYDDGPEWRDRTRTLWHLDRTTGLGVPEGPVVPFVWTPELGDTDEKVKFFGISARGSSVYVTSGFIVYRYSGFPGGPVATFRPLRLLQRDDYPPRLRQVSSRQGTIRVGPGSYL